MDVLVEVAHGGCEVFGEAAPSPKTLCPDNVVPGESDEKHSEEMTGTFDISTSISLPGVSAVVSHGVD